MNDPIVEKISDNLSGLEALEKKLKDENRKKG